MNASGRVSDADPGDLAAELAEAIAEMPASRRAAAIVRAAGMYRLLLLRDLRGATERTIDDAVDAFARKIRAGLVETLDG